MNRHDLCPVCYMKPSLEIKTETYSNMYFHFCSEQCRVTFVENPRLYILNIGREREPNIKKRVIELCDVSDVSFLEGVMGLTAFNVEGSRLSLEYDLYQVTFKKLVNQLLVNRVKLNRSLLQRIKLFFVMFKEDNELNVLVSKRAACCSRPPSSV